MQVEANRKMVLRLNPENSKAFFVYIITLIGTYYYIIPSGRYKLSAMIMCLVGVAYLFFVYNKRILNHILAITLSMIVIAIMFYFVSYPLNAENAIGIITQQFLYIFPIFILYFSQRLKASNTILILIVLISTLFVCVTTWIALDASPTLARLLATGGGTTTTSTEDLLGYRLANIGGFGFSYGMLFVAIASFWNWHRVKKDLLSSVILLLSTVFVLKTQYLTAILLMFISYFIIFVTKENVGIKKIISFFAILLGYIVTPYFLRLISEQIEAQAIANKLNQVADFMSFKLQLGQTTGGIYGRFTVYEISINSFFRSPIWGNNLLTGSNIVGEHSTFLDLGAKTGIIGQIAYIIVIIHIWRMMVDAFDLNDLNGKVIARCIMVPYIILSILNPTLNIFEVSFFSFFVGPLMIIWKSKNFTSQ